METSHFELDNTTQRTQRNSCHWETGDVTYYLINISSGCHQSGLPRIHGFLREMSGPWNTSHALKQKNKKGSLSRYFVLCGTGCHANIGGKNESIWNVFLHGAMRDPCVWNALLGIFEMEACPWQSVGKECLAGQGQSCWCPPTVTSTRVCGFQCLPRICKHRKVWYFQRCRGSGKPLLPPAVPSYFQIHKSTPWVMPQPKAHGFPRDLPTGIRKRWIAVQALTLLHGGDPMCVMSTQRYFPAFSQLRKTPEIPSYLLLVVGNLTWHGDHRPPPLQLLFSPQIIFSELWFHEEAFHFFLGGSSFRSVQFLGAKAKSHFQTSSARLLLIWKVIEKVASHHFSTISSDQRVVKILESPLLAIFKYCVMNKWKQSWWWLPSTANYQHTSVQSRRLSFISVKVKTPWS